ncbi:RICIN domain-containing protein [Streptomyces sp. NPDC021096]|uniref:RICIN domain-containing protein n=1 Tax=Streptomyces sp. NPDC021096 TaxID=3154792 RepID=UPI0033E66512
MKNVAKISALAMSAIAVTMLTPNVSHAEPYFRIVNHGSNKCLEIDNSSDENGARAQQWGCGNQTGNLWYLDHVVNEVYMIRNYSDKCLEISDSRTDNGAPAQQWTCNRRNDGMLWHVSHGKIWNHNSGKPLEIENSSRENGAKAQQWSNADVAGQKWDIVDY